MKTIKIFALFFAIILIGQSCRKDSDDISILPPVIEPQVKVLSSVFGTVTDEQGLAVSNATVWFEDKSVITDEFGVFQFEDESLYSSGTYIQVKKDGYFHGSRRFYPSPGNTSIVNIELMTLETVADFSSAQGSTVTFEDVELDFEANSIMTEDGKAYSGMVNVAAKYLDPTLLNTFDQMPGDLTGVTSDESRVVLTSMAMMAVELFDDSGNELQVQTGKTVDVKIPVPQDLLGKAPATIPMWHFDEEIGTWIEEGSADLVNGMYETSLGHFSFWNCDIPRDFIMLKGSILNRSVPIQGVAVTVTELDGGTSASTITDPNGFFCGFVPNGIDLVLEVFDQCGNSIYTTTIPASEIDVTLDPISLFIETNVATISGSVALCDGTPSSQTFVTVGQGSLNNIITINDDFTFSGTIFYCDDDGELVVGAIDPINGLASATSTYTISGNLDVGEILLCEEQISPIMIFEYGDVTTSYPINNDQQDSIFLAYTVTSLQTNRDIYNVTVLNWQTNIVNDLTLIHVEGEPLQGASVSVTESGFRANGSGVTTVLSQAGMNYLVSTGTLDEIDVVDQSIYDSSYVDLYYYIAFEID